MVDVIIVGAGAAGLIAAGRAASRGLTVLVLEKMERPGRKLLITGKGRCNITNMAPMAEFIRHIYPRGKFLRPAFSRFFNNDLIRLLEENGLETERERGDRVFPKSGQAKDVVDVLMRWVQKHEVEFIYHARVVSLLTDSSAIKGVEVELKEGNRIFEARHVILATGGRSYPATGSTGDGYILLQKEGHNCTDVFPGLVPLNTRGDMAAKLQGLSLKNIQASVWVEDKKYESAFGEMLFTPFGLSGPVILTLSRAIVQKIRDGKKVIVSIDLKPALDDQKLDNRLQRDLNEYGKRKLENIFKLWLPAKMIPLFLEILKLDPGKSGSQLTAVERKKIRKYMKDFRFEISGSRSFKEAIITVGGVSLDEVSSKTMESKIIRNLYIVGELLDLDAETGGYNLQIAFSTAWLAAESLNVED